MSGNGLGLLARRPTAGVGVAGARCCWKHRRVTRRFQQRRAPATPPRIARCQQAQCPSLVYQPPGNDLLLRPRAQQRPDQL